MHLHFHEYLQQALTKLTPEPAAVSTLLMDLLQLSRPSIHKKLKGDVAFSLEEAALICRHFGISIDRFANLGNKNFDKITFDYSLPAEHPRSPIDLLLKIRTDLERMLQIPSPYITYATNEIPIFHSLECRNLLAFKLYVWSRTNWGISPFPDSRFDPDAFYATYPELEDLRLSILDIWSQIPTKEYWPRSVMENILNQIRYYAEARLFEHSDIPGMLLDELATMLKNRQAMAATGFKNTRQNGQPGASYQLFLNEVAYTNNVILVSTRAHPIAVYVTVDNPNFLRSSDEDFCLRMVDWTLRIEECSFQTRTEQYRLNLFQTLLDKVGECRGIIYGRHQARFAATTTADE